MKKNLKKVLGITLAAAMAMPMAAFAGEGGEVEVPEGSIELAYNLSTDDYSIFEQIIKDFTNKNRHINDFVLHGAMVVLNIYFLTLL